MSWTFHRVFRGYSMLSLLLTFIHTSTIPPPDYICRLFRAANLKPYKGRCQDFVVRTGFEPVIRSITISSGIRTPIDKTDHHLTIFIISFWYFHIFHLKLKS
jgi:hypothetical protein